MAQKFITKKIVSTTVKGFALGEDGTPIPSEVVLAGRYTQEKATKEVHKRHNPDFLVTGVEQSDKTYKIPLQKFLQFAEALEDGETAESVEAQEDDATPAEVPQKPAKATAKSAKK